MYKSTTSTPESGAHYDQHLNTGLKWYQLAITLCWLGGENRQMRRQVIWCPPGWRMKEGGHKLYHEWARRGSDRVSYNWKNLFVFGGRGEEGEDILDSFELLDIEKNQWINGHGLLPQPLWYLKLGVFGDVVVLTSARTSRYTTTTKAWMIPVRVLEDSVTNSSSQPIQWTPISDSPYHSSSLLINSKHPVLAGGFRGDKATKDIYRYTSDNWELVGQLSEPRIRSSLITISSNSFLVVGGHSNPNDHSSSMLYSIELIVYS